MQKVMNERVYRDHCGTGFKPERPVLAYANQQRRERHHQYLVGDAVNVSQGADQGFLTRRFQFGHGRTSRAVQLAVDPTYQIVVGEVADEKEERVRGLIQSAVAKVRPGQGACIDVVRLSAGEASLVVSAAFKMPVTAQFGARWRILLARRNRRPRRRAMLVDVAARDEVGDALETKRRDQPVENRRRVGEGDSSNQACVPSLVVDLLKERHRPSDRADSPDQVFSPVQRIGGFRRGRLLADS